jgi:hypothetical protein
MATCASTTDNVDNNNINILVEESMIKLSTRIHKKIQQNL